MARRSGAVGDWAVRVIGEYRTGITRSSGAAAASFSPVPMLWRDGAGEGTARGFGIFACADVGNQTETMLGAFLPPGYGGAQFAPALLAASLYTEFHAERDLGAVAVSNQRLAEELPIFRCDALGPVFRFQFRGRGLQATDAW